MKKFKEFLAEDQKITSAATSRPQIAQAFKIVDKLHGWKEGTTNINIGGGKHDMASEFLGQRKVADHVYDPYNRSAEHNERSLQSAGSGKADTASVFNVLNVIQDEEDHHKVLQQAHDALKPGGRVYVDVYEGDRSGAGKQTGKDSWQRNQRLRDYLKTVQVTFPDAKLEKGIIHGTKQ
jgi:SAM-dependent methyltransferase